VGIGDQVDRVDQFLSDRAKILVDYQPHWNHMTGYRDFQFSWPILEEATGLTRAYLRFRVPDGDFRFPTIGLILNGVPVCRVDRADPAVCKPNPPWAARLGLPSHICGTHAHSWADNRNFVLTSSAWEQPARRPIEADLTGLDDMFLWFCGEIGVRIQPHNRPLRMPEGGLFARTN
jgi:hypothetical protein